mgnify:CR=1 FL=1
MDDSKFQLFATLPVELIAYILLHVPPVTLYQYAK